MLCNGVLTVRLFPTPSLVTSCRYLEIDRGGRTYPTRTGNVPALPGPCVQGCFFFQNTPASSEFPSLFL